MTLAGYEGELRQLTVMELGHEEATILLTNHRKLGPVELVDCDSEARGENCEPALPACGC